MGLGSQEEVPLCCAEGGSPAPTGQEVRNPFLIPGLSVLSPALCVTDVIAPLEDYLMAVCPSQMLRETIGTRC